MPHFVLLEFLENFAVFCASLGYWCITPRANTAKLSKRLIARSVTQGVGNVN
jgi:hypothetical protein